MPSAPDAAASSNAAIVFSGRGPRTPRCPKMSGGPPSFRRKLSAFILMDVPPVLAYRAIVSQAPLSSPADARRLFATRGFRGFADGLVSVLLASHLSNLGYSPTEIGAIVTGTLLGSAALPSSSELRR